MPGMAFDWSGYMAKLFRKKTLLCNKMSLKVDSLRLSGMSLIQITVFELKNNKSLEVGTEGLII